jgi:hypothetical protein
MSLRVTRPKCKLLAPRIVLQDALPANLAVWRISSAGSRGHFTPAETFKSKASVTQNYMAMIIRASPTCMVAHWRSIRIFVSIFVLRWDNEWKGSGTSGVAW